MVSTSSPRHHRPTVRGGAATAGDAVKALRHHARAASSHVVVAVLTPPTKSAETSAGAGDGWVARSALLLGHLIDDAGCSAAVVEAVLGVLEAAGCNNRAKLQAVRVLRLLIVDASRQEVRSDPASPRPKFFRLALPAVAALAAADQRPTRLGAEAADCGVHLAARLVEAHPAAPGGAVGDHAVVAEPAGTVPSAARALAGLVGTLQRWYSHRATLYSAGLGELRALLLDEVAAPAPTGQGSAVAFCAGKFGDHLLASHPPADTLVARVLRWLLDPAHPPSDTLRLVILALALGRCNPAQVTTALSVASVGAIEMWDLLLHTGPTVALQHLRVSALVMVPAAIRHRWLIDPDVATAEVARRLASLAGDVEERQTQPMHPPV